jgi:hypothetical protein
MKNKLVIVITLVIASCGNNTATDNNTTTTDSALVTTPNAGDTIKPLLNDSVADGNSSSSSDFNKGNTSPAGSTGVIGSTRAKSADSMGIKKVKDKKAKKDSTHR